MTRPTQGFDAQAADFDRRAGLPAKVCRRAARAAVQLAGLEPSDLLVEIGAGTGQIGLHLAEGSRYLGLDLSAAMLDRFRARLEGPRSGLRLVRADARRPWPVADASTAAVFGSRALHLLDPGHVVGQARRLALPTGLTLVLGRVRRSPEGPKEGMRRRMRRFLQEAGIDPRPRAGPALAEACRAAGGRVLAEVTAASWTLPWRALDSIESWRRVEGLAGRAVPAQVKKAVLDRLEAWAAARPEGLEGGQEQEERYVLEGYHLPAATKEAP